MKFLMTTLFGSMMVLLVACDNQNIENAANKAEDKADEIGDKLKEPFQNPAEEVEEQLRDGVAEIKE